MAVHWKRPEDLELVDARDATQMAILHIPKLSARDPARQLDQWQWRDDIGYATATTPWTSWRVVIVQPLDTEVP